MNSEWQPTAPRSNLELRAKVLKKIRAFFEERNVLEVDTPIVSHATVTDPQLASFETTLLFSGSNHYKPLYLQTSPEFAMKRLLAAGYGSIYQICKAFRNGEVSKKHNPEFTILEWYRLGFTHFDLMDEVNFLIENILETESAERVSYSDLFYSYFSLNPHTCDLSQLKKVADKYGLIFKDDADDKDIWLNLLLSHLIEPELGLERPLFIYDYPGSQAALAQIREEDGYKVGERFELYFKGLELANGYHELGDANEQRLRFEHDNTVRNRLNLPTIPLDVHLLNALPTFPKCAGVALGLDRLLCLAGNTDDITKIIAFPISRA